MTLIWIKTLFSRCSATSMLVFRFKIFCRLIFKLSRKLTFGLLWWFRLTISLLFIEISSTFDGLGEGGATVNLSMVGFRWLSLVLRDTQLGSISPKKVSILIEAKTRSISFITWWQLIIFFFVMKWFLFDPTLDNFPRWLIQWRTLRHIFRAI